MKNFVSRVCFLFFLLSCATNREVSTQIDIRKNPVVNVPVEFQSPIEAINGFLESKNSKISKDSLVRKIRDRSLSVLLNQHDEVAKELKNSGKLRLQPNQSYEFSLESFCVNTGIERPVRGDGLFLGDLKGNAKSWLPIILKKHHSLGISQEEAQVLVWSLLSKAKFDQLSTKSQSQLIKIFPDAPVRFGNSFLEDKAIDFLSSQATTELISAKEQYLRFQEILQDTHAKYSEMEQVLSPASPRLEAIDVGWLKHEDGYYIHLQANGYQQVRVKIYAPEGIKKDTFFDPLRHVALPGQGQRLALSNHVIDEFNNRSGKYVKDKTGVSTSESLFILKHPIDAYKIYEASKKAMQLTWNHQTSSHNFQDDRADAFRHFVWSALVTNEIGAEKAREYLTAHEDFPNNNYEAKSMDLFNNEQGIKFSHEYKGSSFEEDLIQECKEKIRNHELRWIK